MRHCTEMCEILCERGVCIGRGAHREDVHMGEIAGKVKFSVAMENLGKIFNPAMN